MRSSVGIKNSGGFGGATMASGEKCVWESVSLNFKNTCPLVSFDNVQYSSSEHWNLVDTGTVRVGIFVTSSIFGFN